jgi:hypothetical protein
VKFGVFVARACGRDFLIFMRGGWRTCVQGIIKPQNESRLSKMAGNRIVNRRPTQPTLHSTTTPSNNIITTETEEDPPQKNKTQTVVLL